jgi:hypothetical protein
MRGVRRGAALAGCLAVTGALAAPSVAAAQESERPHALDLRGLHTTGSRGVPGVWMPCEAPGGWTVNVQVTSDSSVGPASAVYWWTGGGEHSTPLRLGDGQILALAAEHYEDDPASDVIHRWSAERRGHDDAVRFECFGDYGSAVTYQVRADIAYLDPPVEPTHGEQLSWCESQWWWDSSPEWCPVAPK